MNEQELAALVASVTPERVKQWVLELEPQQPEANRGTVPLFEILEILTAGLAALPTSAIWNARADPPELRRHVPQSLRAQDTLDHGHRLVSASRLTDRQGWAPESAGPKVPAGGWLKRCSLVTRCRLTGPQVLSGPDLACG